MSSEGSLLHWPGLFVSWRSSLRQRVSQHTQIVSFLAGVTVCGLVFGGLVAGELNPADTAVLGGAVERVVTAIQQHALAPAGQLWWQRLVADGQLLALLWLFGVSVIGLPLIVIALFLRAFGVGFAVGFTVLQFGWKGFLVAGLVIFLHQAISLTVLVAAGAVAVRFSAGVLRQAYPFSALPVHFLRYTAIFCVCAGLLMLGAAVQAYFAPGVLGDVLSRM